MTPKALRKIKPVSTNRAFNATESTNRAAVFTDQYIFHHVVEAEGATPTTNSTESTSMKRVVVTALAVGALGIAPAFADPLSLQANRYPPSPSRTVAPAYTGSVARPPAPIAAVEPQQQPVRYAAVESRPDLGGGFIEFLFGDGHPVSRPRNTVAYAAPGEPAQPAMDPKYLKQVVDYRGPEKPGTIIVDTPNRFLFLVQADGTAMRYGIGVGKPGFSWAGMKTITAKKEWPDWRPPEEMLQRRPDLPTFMAGGPENPLGARAMYLGSTLYRIHGSNEPWTIGTAVSSGCIRMRNEDVVDLYERVKVGTKVLVI